MKSKASLAGHPLHAMLVDFPIVSYVATFASLIVYAASGDPFWFRLALVANVVGVVTAILAAIPGAVDYFTVVPKETVARRTGGIHAVLNVSALVLLAISLIVLYGQYAGADEPSVVAPIILSGVGLVLTMAAGFFGYEMIQHHHVGVTDMPDRQAVNSPKAVAARWMEEAPPVTDSQVIGSEEIAPGEARAGHAPRSEHVRAHEDEKEAGRWWPKEGDSGRDTGPIGRQ
ncbi:MAG TPA: DUF2231 domain-containing protein [Kofleriaceae bacterium]|nr:DUF2231 domain-containing protein [Kofleriaceae bacterium]